MPGIRQDLRLALQKLAFGQSGFFTAAQALNLGYSYQAQKYHADHGNWLRIDRGLFRLPDWPAATSDSYVRWTLWSGGRGVVSHETALSVHELSDLDPRHIHLTVPPGFRADDDAVAIHVASLDDSDIDQYESFRVTTPLRTLVDVAASHTAQEHVDRAVDEALEKGLFSVRRLRESADAHSDRATARIERALSVTA